MLRISKKLLAIGLVASAWAVSSCGNRLINNAESGKTKDGNEYRIYRTGDDSHKITEGDLIDFHFVVKNHKDSLLQSSYQSQGGQPVKPIEAYPFSEKESQKTILAMMKMLTVGDSAVFRIKTEIEYKENQDGVRKSIEQMKKNVASLPDSVREKNADKIALQLKQAEAEINKPSIFPKGTFLTYQIKILKVENLADKQKKEKADAEKSSKKEKEDIDKYIAANKLKPTVTKSGLQYVIIKEGKGESPKKGTKVKVHYTGKLADGKVFDSSEKKEPIEFPLGIGQVIQGWDEGIMLLNKGAKAILIIPNVLGYGGASQPGSPIPPYSPLFFEVELVDFK